MNEAKPFEIDKRLIYEAYKKVRSNRGSGGIDGITMEEFDADLSNNLYRPMELNEFRQLYASICEIGRDTKTQWRETSFRHTDPIGQNCADGSGTLHHGHS